MTADNFPEDGDRFFEALAGRAHGLSGAEALREALEAEARTLRDAEGAGAEHLSDEDRQTMVAVRQRLVDAGLLPATPPLPADGGKSPTLRPLPVPSPSAGLWTNRVARLGEWLFTGDWLRSAAIAASLVAVGLVVVEMGLPTKQASDEVLRGDTGSDIAVLDPAATAADMERRLTAAGAEVIRAQVNDAEWALEVNVEKPQQLDHVRKILSEAGFLVGQQPPYRLLIRRK